MSTLPERPVTPTLDALWTAHGIGAERYTKAVPPGVGWTDGALSMYESGTNGNGQAIDTSAVSAKDVDAARKYLADVWEASKIVESTIPQSAVQPIAQPVAVGAPVPAVPVPAPAPVAEHHASVWHAIASYVTPENVADVLQLIIAFKRKKS